MTIISPSILSCDFLNIEPDLRALNEAKDIWIHLDIMDGHFVPNLTFGHPIVKKIPSVTDHALDAHFMVTNPEFYIDTFKDYKIHNFTFHIEATEDPLRLIKKAKDFYPSVGLSIKPKTSVSELTDEILKELDLVLVMSVEPGFGGQSFMENSLEKIKELKMRRKDLGTSLSIQVDGGINAETSKRTIEAGADNLVAGSFIFKNKQEEYLTVIEQLRK